MYSESAHQNFFVLSGNIVYKSLFFRMPKLRMPTLPMKTLRNSSVEECAKSCAQETSFDCRSFDVDSILQTCRLHNHSMEDHRLSLIVSKNTDHYRSKKDFTNYPLSCRSYFRTITIKWLRYMSF